MPAFAGEIFGPVAPIVPFRTDTEAVEIANDTAYGLAVAVHSRSVRRATAVAEPSRRPVFCHRARCEVVHSCPARIGGCHPGKWGSNHSVTLCTHLSQPWNADDPSTTSGGTAP
ncbi:aldehyde dehydrogenase family protein [Streptacidiphilus sp. EB103A]|uniref:aldehyde dehydrogenase family protein n=1 Tax=Streptacidiphilus sp. EB103A TaxID=3156275 RepID=UPI0035183F80